jgi:hypothetical protein
MEARQHVEDHSVEPTALANTTNEADLLQRAKDAIDAGEQRLHEAAEVLALAHSDFKLTQRDLANAIGRSASWVNRLLKWRQSGYKEHSPFGPTTTTGRVSHAKQRASKPRRSTIDHDAEASAAKRTAEYARQEAEHEIAATIAAQTPISRKYSPAQAKGELKFAIDQWWPRLDEAGRSEMTTYFMKKAELPVS